jgi:hypothetical protein
VQATTTYLACMRITKWPTCNEDTKYSLLGKRETERETDTENKNSFQIS